MMKIRSMVANASKTGVNSQERMINGLQRLGISFDAGKLTNCRNFSMC